MRRREDHEEHVQRVLAELLSALESDPAMDVDEFVVEQGAIAQTLHERLDALRRFGLLDPVGSRAPHPEWSENVSVRPGVVVDGRYEIMDELGRGGMGLVHRAMDLRLRRKVAFKTIRFSVADGPLQVEERLGRFRAEVEFTAGLEHPSIVPIYDCGTVEHSLYYTMRLVEGRSLATVLSGDPPPIRRRVEIVQRICDALSYAHHRGVLHRDLKPQNVMVGRFGEVFVLDWGMARVARSISGADESDFDANRTAPHATIGTPAYMSAEQAGLRNDEIDEQTDVANLGALLFHALTGRAPYHSPGAQVEEVLRRAREGRIRYELGERRRLPRELVAVIESAMHVDKAARYGSVSELAGDLHAFLEDRPGRAWRDGVVRRGVKWVRRHPSIGAAMAVGVVIGTIAIAAWRVQAQARELNARRLLYTQLGALQRSGGGDPGIRDTNYVEVAEDYEDLFVEYGFSLRETDLAAARIEELRLDDPELWGRVIEALLQLEWRLSDGWLMTASRDPEFAPRLRARAGEHWRGVDESRLDRALDMARSLGGILDRVIEDEWVRSLRHLQGEVIDAHASTDGRFPEATLDRFLRRYEALGEPPAAFLSSLLGHTLFAAGLRERARHHFSAAVEAGHYDYWTLVRYGIDAEDEYERLVRFSQAFGVKRCDQGRYHMAIALAEVDAFAYSIQLFEDLLDTEEWSVRATWQLSSALEMAGELPRALVMIERTLTKAPKSMKVHGLRVKIMQRLHGSVAALDAYEDARLARPEEAPIYRKHHRWFVEHLLSRGSRSFEENAGDPRARRVLEEFRELYPDDIGGLQLEADLILWSATWPEPIEKELLLPALTRSRQLVRRAQELAEERDGELTGSDMGALTNGRFVLNEIERQLVLAGELGGAGRERGELLMRAVERLEEIKLNGNNLFMLLESLTEAMRYDEGDAARLERHLGRWVSMMAGDRAAGFVERDRSQWSYFARSLSRRVASLDRSSDPGWVDHGSRIDAHIAYAMSLAGEE